MTVSARGTRSRLATRVAVVIVLTAAVVAPSLLDSHERALAAGTELLTDSFSGTSITDPNFVVLGSNFTPCLTASTTTVQGSRIPACAAGDQAIPSGGDGAGSGVLRLTNAGTNQAGAVLYNRALPLAEGARISFDFAMYGGTLHADGISFFIADGNVDLTATGANGGSLGYAQKTGTPSDDAPGLTGGYLGLGLDEYGNYELDTEGRGSSPSGTYTCTDPNMVRVANRVGLRGPGNGDDGYCLLASTALDPSTQSLFGPGPTRTAGGTLDSAQITVDPPGPGAMVTVGLAFGVTGTARNYTQVFSVPEPPGAPETFKFGLASSTGGKTDIHEIGNMSVSTVTPRPVVSITQSDTSGGIVDAGGTGTLLLHPVVGTEADESLAPTVTDTLPVGLTVAAVPTVTGYDCSATQVGSQTLSCTYTGARPLTAGSAMPDIALSVLVASSASGSLTATASVGSLDAATASAAHTLTAVAPPVAVADRAATVTNGSVAIPVLANDTGTGTLTTAVTTDPTHGQLTLLSDGSYSYTPTPGYSGPDSFTYTVTDARGVTSAPVTVSITVAPAGVAGTGSTAAGVPLHGTSLLAGATGTGPFTSIKDSNPAHGTVTVAPGGTYTYTPAPGFSGVDSFTYVIDDADGHPSAPITVTITVAPTAVADSGTVAENHTLAGGSVLKNDDGKGLTAVLVTGTAHGSVTLHADGTYTYTPDAGYVGPDSFTYDAQGAGGSSTPTTVSITVVPGTPLVTGGTPQTITVGGTLAPITFTSPGGGTVTTSDPGALPPGVTLLPTGGFSGSPTAPGTYTFPVTITDPAGGTTTVLATITVLPVATPSGRLPFTGAPIEFLIGWALRLTAAGGLAISLGRRRRRSRLR